MQDLQTALLAGDFHLELGLARFVKDALMAIFFRRRAGDQARVPRKRARRPAPCRVADRGAVGGMVAPALIYVAINFGEPTLRGWGVPMATDIAFAVAVLALVGDRVPLGLKVLLLTLAIVYDLGAVTVIALFYTDSVNATALLLSLGALALAVLYGRLGHARPGVLFLIGLVCWYVMLESGMHATIVGVLMALAIPLGGKLPSRALEVERPEIRLPFSGGVDLEVEPISYPADRVQSPLMTFEHSLSPWVAFVIMAAFAIFNAGVALGGGGHAGEAGASANAAEASLIGLPTIGVFLALLLGKPLGIAFRTWIAVSTGLASFPRGSNWMRIVGIGCLGGIGFMMAVFVANVAFGASVALDQAKIGVLSASVVSAVLGFVLLAPAFADAPPQTTAAGAGH